MNIVKKNFIWNIIGSTAAAFTSLIFLIVSTRINGEKQAGIFSFAFATATILYVLGTYILRSFQVTDTTNDFSDTDYIYNRIITCLLMMVAGIGFVIIKDYSFIKAVVIILLCLLRCFEAFAEVIFGIIQKSDKLYQVGISMFTKAIIEVAVFAIVDYTTKSIVASSLAVALAYLSIILIYDIPKLKKNGYTKTEFSTKKNNNLFKAGFFTFFFTVMNLYLINAARYSLDGIYDDGVQAIYGIVIMPATFMSLLGMYLIQPFLTSISNSIKTKDYSSLKKSVFFICACMVGLAIVVYIVAYFLEEPVLSFVFGINLANYKKSMLIVIFGSAFYGLVSIVSNILIAYRKTASQAIIYFAVSGLTLFVSKYLVKKYEILGASLTYSISMILLFALLFIVLIFSTIQYKKDWRKEEVNKQ